MGDLQRLVKDEIFLTAITLLGIRAFDSSFVETGQPTGAVTGKPLRLLVRVETLTLGADGCEWP